MVLHRLQVLRLGSRTVARRYRILIVGNGVVVALWRQWFLIVVLTVWVPLLRVESVGFGRDIRKHILAACGEELLLGR